MSNELSKSLKDLYASRQSGADMLQNLKNASAAFHSLRSSSSSSSSSSAELGDALRSLRWHYRQAFSQSSNELKLAGDALEKMRRAMVKREAQWRKDKDKKRNGDGEENGSSSSANGSSAGGSASKKQKGANGVVLVSGANEGGDIWSHDGIRILDVGSTVAALTDEHSKPPLWILATVAGFKAAPRPRYEVEDIDRSSSDDSFARTKKYLLESRKIIPLPPLSIVPLRLRKEFSRHERVLAVFPEHGTTVLYPATVLQPPRKRKADEYLLAFDDDEEEQVEQGRVVQAQWVCPLPANYGQTDE